MYRWLFTDRHSGEIVIGQAPNGALLATVVLAALSRFVLRRGTSHTVALIGAGLALIWWSGDEIIRGVNPFRRALGGVVLIGVGLAAWRIR